MDANTKALLEGIGKAMLDERNDMLKVIDNLRKEFDEKLRFVSGGKTDELLRSTIVRRLDIARQELNVYATSFLHLKATVSSDAPSVLRRAAK
jgi:hypothetical protein